MHLQSHGHQLSMLRKLRKAPHFSVLLHVVVTIECNIVLTLTTLSPIKWPSWYAQYTSFKIGSLQNPS